MVSRESVDPLPYHPSDPTYLRCKSTNLLRNFWNLDQRNCDVTNERSGHTTDMSTTTVTTNTTRTAPGPQPHEKTQVPSHIPPIHQKKLHPRSHSRLAKLKSLSEPLTQPQTQYQMELENQQGSSGINAEYGRTCNSTY
eukprot:TRINITY_DN6007_c0_g1_i6.p1 TRINITY_DN6007_c0_g1~~TRINITY_DN6007_c0_g1_i6.p1  ORF type:complete len:139 (+),score=15.06 TRINITY_DN6007_c0_g1_i6:373-789(+)